jgi:hypothetical protein
MKERKFVIGSPSSVREDPLSPEAEYLPIQKLEPIEAIESMNQQSCNITLYQLEQAIAFTHLPEGF